MSKQVRVEYEMEVRELSRGEEVAWFVSGANIHGRQLTPEELGEQAMLNYVHVLYAGGKREEVAFPMETLGRDLLDMRAWMRESEKYKGVADKWFGISEQLEGKLRNKEVLTVAEGRQLEDSVVEAMSTLFRSGMVSDAMSPEGNLPGWMRPVISACAEASTHAPEYAVIGDALRELEAAAKESTEGAKRYQQAVNKLMANNRDVLERMFKEYREDPTAEQIARMEEVVKRAQDEQDARVGRGRSIVPVRTEARIAEARQEAAEEAEAQAAEEAEAQEEEAAARQDIKELPGNEGMSEEEVTRERAERYAEAQEEKTAQDPAAQEDKEGIFSGGRYVLVQADGFGDVKAGMVPVERIGFAPEVPQFKAGADENGVVHTLTGFYRPDHDPIRVWQRADGQLQVISGRHRLAYARQAGATRIMAYVYKEDGERNAQWARTLDMEQNIRDNQATEPEIALYVRGDNAHGRQLTEEEIAQAGLDRKGSKGQRGVLLGRYAADEVIDALRNELYFTVDDAVRVVEYAKGDRDVQVEGLRVMLGERDEQGVHSNPGSITQARLTMQRFLEVKRRNEQMGIGGEQGLFGFGESLMDTQFNRFYGKYQHQKQRQLATDRAYLNKMLGGKVSKETEEAVRKKVGKRFEVEGDDKLSLQEIKKRLDELAQKWKNPAAYEECMDEMVRAFREEYAGEEWMDDGRIEQARVFEEPRAHFSTEEGKKADNGLLGKAWDDARAGKETESYAVKEEDVVRSAESLKEALNEKRKKKSVYTNAQNQFRALLSQATIKKSGTVMMSRKNLSYFGIDDEAARVIHYTAAAHIGELFEKARSERYFEEDYKNTKGREGAHYLYSRIDVPGYGAFDVKIIATQPKGKGFDPSLYNLELTIESPVIRVDSELKGTVSTHSSTGLPGDRLSAYRSNVEHEILKIREEAIKDGTYLKAPNGEDSKLDEQLWGIVRTRAFKDWFGDWENDPEGASKVVDENGEPMVVYHGTPEDFGNVFEDKQPESRDYDPNYYRGTFWFADRRFTAQTYQAKAVFTRYPEAPRRLDTEWEHEDVPAGEHADVLEGLRERTVFRAYDTRHSLHGVRVKLSEAFDEDGMLKEDYYVALELKKGEERVLPSGKRLLGRQLFAASRGSNYFLQEGVKPPRTHKEALEFYARFDGVGDRISVPVRSRLYACFLNVRNPKVYDYEGEKFRDMGYRAMEAQAEGHDGVVVQNVYDPGEYPDAVLPGMSIGVFSPEQIKSVDNRGTFDAGNPNIHFSLGGERAATYGEMEAAGLAYYDPADGKRKFALPTAGVRLKENFTPGELNVPDKGHKDVSLAALLHYPELFRAYPELGRMRVRLYKEKGTGVRGFYAPNGTKPKEGSFIALNMAHGTEPERVLTTLLHESQHAIQHHEGWARGAGDMDRKGALKYVRKAMAERKKQGLESDWAKENMSFLTSLHNILMKGKGQDLQMAIDGAYWMSHGEQEARYAGDMRTDVNEEGAPRVTGVADGTDTIAVLPEKITELGGITFGNAGIYARLMESRLAPVGDFQTDRRLYQIRESAVRYARLLSGFTREKDKTGESLLLEAQGVAERAVSLLPNEYRVGLEPYRVWLSVFAELSKGGFAAAERASEMVPMRGWGDRIYRSIGKQISSVFSGRVRESEMEFWLEREEGRKLFEQAREMYNEAKEKAKATGAAGQSLYELTEVYLRDDARYHGVVEQLIGELGKVKTEKVLAKLLERVKHQLDAYRKDKTLGAMRKAVAAAYPAPGKGGKPVKGKMNADSYRALEDYMALLELTEGERAMFERERYTGEGKEKAWADLEDGDLVTVDTYDEDGKKRVITCTKMEYETYACYEGMTAEQAEAAARALGEFITTGRQAWDNKQDEKKREVAGWCRDILDEFDTSENARRAEAVRNEGVLPARKALLNLTSWTMNPAQIFDVLAHVPGLQTFARHVGSRIERAEVQLQEWDKERLYRTAEIMRQECGAKSKKELRQFIDDMNLTRESGIELIERAPDFLRQESEVLRRQFLGLLHRKMRQKNFNANTFAAAFEELVKDELMPDFIAEEARAKYGAVGDAKKARLHGVDAVFSLLTRDELEKFYDLRKETVKRAKKAEEKWLKEKEEKKAKLEEMRGEARENSFGKLVQKAFGAENKPKKKAIFAVCAFPDFLKRLKKWEGSIHISWENMYKLHHKHYMTPEQIAELPREINDPIAVIEDRDGSLLVVTSLDVPTKKSVEEAQADASKEVVKRKAIAVLKLGKSAKTGIEIVDMITAYAHDTSAKQKGLLREGRLLYLDKARAGEWTSKEEDSIPPLIETLLAEPGSKVMLKESGEEVKENSLQLTKGEAAYRVLLAEQPAYTEMLRQQGYTEEVVQQLREFAGEKVMNLAYALRAELAKRTPEMKALYEKVYGMPFPEEENYFRAFFDVGQETEQRTLGERAEGKASGGGKIYITYTRHQHHSKVDPTMNLLTAYLTVQKQQDVLLAYRDLPQKIQGVLAHQEGRVRMSAALERVVGRGMATNMRTIAEHMQAAAGEVERVGRDLTNVIDSLGSAAAHAVLNGRVASNMKQFTALFNTLAGSDSVSLWEWEKSKSRVLAGLGVISTREMAARPELASRFKGWEAAGLGEAMFAKADEVTGHGATASESRAGMSFMEKLDVWNNVKSSCILYDAVYRKMKKENPGLTHEELDGAAMEEVRHALAMKSQPQGWRTRSLLATKRSIFSVGNLFLGGESINTFANTARLLAEGRYGRAAAVWFAHGAALQALTFLYNWITDDEEQWKRRSWKQYAMGVLAGPFMSVPVVGLTIANLGNAVGGGWVPTQNLLPGADLPRLCRQVKSIFGGKKKTSWMDKTIAVNELLRTVAMGALIGKPKSAGHAKVQGVAMGATLVSNLLDFVLRTARAADERM